MQQATSHRRPLRDAAFFNEILQPFSAGTVLNFHVNTTPAFAGGTPDSLTFFVLDNGTGLPVPTVDPSGADSLVEIDLLPTPAIHTFGSDSSRTSLVILAPVVGGTSGGTLAPEPSVGQLYSCGILAFWTLQWRRSKRYDWELEGATRFLSVFICIHLRARWLSCYPSRRLLSLWARR
jgi:hypothetical protein